MISNTENKVLMQQARESLKNKWGSAIGAAAILLVFNVLAEIPFFGFLIFLLVLPNLQVGFAIFFLSISRNKEANLNQLFESFKDSLKESLGSISLIIPYSKAFVLGINLPCNIKSKALEVPINLDKR